MIDYANSDSLENLCTTVVSLFIEAISDRVDRASATEAIDSGSITG